MAPILQYIDESANQAIEAVSIISGERPIRTESPTISSEITGRLIIQQVLRRLRLDQRQTEDQNIRPPMTKLSHLFELSILIRRERARGRTQPRAFRQVGR